MNVIDVFDMYVITHTAQNVHILYGAMLVMAFTLPDLDSFDCIPPEAIDKYTIGPPERIERIVESRVATFNDAIDARRQAL